MRKILFLLFTAVITNYITAQTIIAPPTDTNLEGGQLRLMNSNSNYNLWDIDNYAGNLRFFHSGSVPFNIKPDGSIGINTTSPIPGTKLTVNGHVNIGGTANYHLRTRHIDGKHYETAEIDQLYLNYGTGKDVLVGFGSTNPASDLKVSGRLGIGTTNPTHHIDVMNIYEATESFLRFRVQDAPSDYFTISNGTSQEGQFIPYIKGRHVSDNRTALGIMGETSDANDIGGSALIHFDARKPGAPIQNRPLFAWTSYTTRMMTMLANGSLGIGTTSTGPHKLAVEGSIGARKVKVQATGWSDFVFKNTYNLPTLEEVEKHIQEKGHLQNIPSTEDVVNNGIDLGEMDAKLLQKIEELTLYTIEQEKRIKTLEDSNQEFIELFKELIKEKSN